jgi:putative membrane protein
MGLPPEEADMFRHRIFIVRPGFGPRFNDWSGPGHALLAVFLMVVVLVVAVAVVVALVRPGRRRWHHPHDAPVAASDSGAESILRERLARGEIGEDEYRRTLAVLRGAP